MASFWQTFLCAILLAGGALCETEDLTPINLESGETFTAYVLTLLDNVTYCYLVTAGGLTVQLIPEQTLNNDRFQLREPNSLVGCSVDVKQVDEKDNGVWELHTLSKEGVVRSHKYNIVVQSNTEVEENPVEESESGNLVPEQGESKVKHIMWTIGQSVDLQVGPSDATYCQVYDPSGLLIHEAVECRLTVDKVHTWHSGLWKLNVWTAGKVESELWEIVATVSEADKPTVTTKVQHTSDSVLLSCSVGIASETKDCQFEEPQGIALRVAEGVSQGRFSYFLTQSESSQVTACGLRITNPTEADMGRWRCRITTDQQTHFGFLPVASALVGDVDDIKTTPQLRATRPVVPVAAGERPVLSCSLHAAIRYCYFTAARNGTVYNVYPGAEDYVGNGLEAGECGIRLPAVRADDLTAWRCHVGVSNSSRPEYSAEIALEVTGKESMSIRLQWNSKRSPLHIQGEVAGTSLDYCRFVRMDGTGFTAANAPQGYLVSQEVQAEGRCLLVVLEPSAIDLHPWTVVARVSGQGYEVSAVTRNLMNVSHFSYSGYVTLWVMIILISLSLFVAGLLMGPRRNREWTYRQAATIRAGVRNSIRKTPLTEEKHDLA